MLEKEIFTEPEDNTREKRRSDLSPTFAKFDRMTISTKSPKPGVKSRNKARSGLKSPKIKTSTKKSKARKSRKEKGAFSTFD